MNAAMKLRPDDRVLTGAWVMSGSRVVGDATCQRIDALIDSHLQKLGVDATGWETIYSDPDDNRLWEHTYPHSEMHGGGPPELRVIDRKTACGKYGDLGSE